MTEKFDKKTLEEELKKKIADEDDDQNFIRKDEPQEQKCEVKEGEEVQGVIQKLKNVFFPKPNQQRNLARETGGLEVKKDKGISEDDVWDERSEEVDGMATNVFNSSGMRSVVWKKKRERLEAAELALELAEIGKTLKSKGTTATPTQGYISRLKNLQQDRTDINGGASR
ncbi:MAG: hypothetical protein KA100_01835 [Rickettsiales bacterium]|nr:hypothetical protein [Rickettsiales bacterium]